MYNIIWIDYFTGEQYRGGQVLNNFDAPLWKLPVFVKVNAIIPMYEPNNNPQDIDRSVRNVEFFATAGENSYTQFEDDGIFIDSDLKESEDKEYGTENHVNYGDHVSTTYKSSVKGDVATFTAEKSTGSYKGYAPEHTTSFVVNVSKEPTSVVVKNGDAALKKVEVKTQEEFDKAQPKDGEFVYFYNAKPNLNYGSSSDATDAVKKEGFSSQEIYADDIKNANALGALINFQSDAFEYVNGSLTKSPYTAGMEDLSVVHSDFVDGKQSVNISFQNRGEQDLYSGTGAVASFQLKAKKAGEVKLPSTAWAMGAQLDYIETVDDGTINYPDAPEPEAGELAMGDFDLTMTNAALPTDDGTNVTQMTQGGTYEPLFDGVEFHDGNSGAGTFEFKWATETDTVSTPVTLHFDLKQNRALDNFEIVNRKDAGGTVAGNGFIKKLEATIFFEDGTEQVFKGGEFDTAAAAYTLTPSAENAAKKVDRVDVNVLETNGSKHLLTISEVNFNYTDQVADVESVVLGDNATTLFVGELSAVQASVMPESIKYNQFEVESSDPSVAGIVTKQVGENVVNFVRGNKPGKATITVRSVLDKTKAATYEVEVKEGVNTSALEAALADARALNAAAYTEESYAKLAEAVKAGEDLLKSGAYTEQQVADATVAIRDAIKGLEVLPIDESKLINTKENKDAVAVTGFSSQCEPQTIEDGLAANVLDYNDQSQWHSDYINSVGMPQYLEFDLGASYDLTGMKFLPRQSGQNGDVFEARVYVADTAEGLKTASPVGTFKFDNNGSVLNDRDQFKEMGFGATGRFVKFEIVHSGGDRADQYASLAEMRFYGTKASETPQADASKLQALVDKIHGENLKAEDYTVETWTKFELALGDAEKTLADPQATQAEIDSQLNALQKAYDGLVKTEVPPVEKPSKDELKDLVAKAEALDATGKTPSPCKRSPMPSPPPRTSLPRTTRPRMRSRLRTTSSPPRSTA